MNLTNSAIDLHLAPMLAGIEQALPVFERIYGRLLIEAVRGVDAAGKGNNEKPRKLPLWYDQTRKTMLPVAPDEKKGGLLFAITTGASRVLDAEPGWALQGGSQFKQVPIALIGWWNGLLALTNNNEPMTVDTVRQTVESKLGKWYDWQTTTAEDQLSARLFAGLDYDMDNHTYLVHPYHGFRIEGLLTIKESVCLSS